MRDIIGMPGEEVARELGLSLPAMKSRLHRARGQLRSKMRRAVERDEP